MTSTTCRGDSVGPSDSGPIGAPVRKLLGLDDADVRDDVWEATKAAIAYENLRDLKCVGKGGYGVVCQAKDVATGNDRAVKVVLKPEDDERVRLFERECRILAAVEMPSDLAPRYFNSKRTPGAQPFLVMEWIEGLNLSDWLDAHPQLVMRDREALCRAIFATYSRLHAANFIHRDVSLRNIMVTPGRKGHRIRLIDFGGSGRAQPGYASMHTISRVPTTEAFVSDPVRAGERKPSLADEVHAVAKVCFYVLTSDLAFGKSQDERLAIMRAKQVSPEVMAILLPKMENPPLKIALQTQAQEF